MKTIKITIASILGVILAGAAVSTLHRYTGVNLESALKMVPFIVLIIYFAKVEEKKKKANT